MKSEFINAVAFDVKPYVIRAMVSGAVYLKSEPVFVKASGYSHRNPVDEFNEVFGKALAITRAKINFYKKIERILINYSYELSAKAKKKERASVSIAKWHLDELHKYLDKGVK